MCKLTLATDETITSDKSPSRPLKLRCLIYSWPALMETVWLRAGQQVAVNRSQQTNLDYANATTEVQLAVAGFAEQLDPLLSETGQTMPPFDYQCIARNALGHSESCQLSQTSKLSLFSK